MKQLILKMSVSVDGFVSGPNGEIDWIFKHYDSEATAWTVETLWQAGVHIMGSRTFQDMAAYWPTSTEPFAPPMNEMPKVVFSRSGLGSARSTHATSRKMDVTAEPSHLSSWTNPGIAIGDLATDIARLKQQPGKPILAHGGASFARSLVRLGLVDEFRLLIHPVVLGRGLPLFSDLPKPLDLTRVSTIAFDGGAVAHIYRPT